MGSCVLVILSLSLLHPEAVTSAPPRSAKGWRIFVNRAGWSIRVPENWQIESCNQCPDPTDPGVFVFFYDPPTKTGMMIEPLADKPRRDTAESWLLEVSQDTVLAPRVRTDWVSLDHRRALKVLNGDTDSNASENIYVLFGQKTFAIRTAPNDAGYSTIKQMLSTFRFVSSGESRTRN